MCEPAVLALPCQLKAWGPWLCPCSEAATPPGGPGQVMASATFRNMAGATRPGTHGTFQKWGWHAGLGKGFKLQQDVWEIWTSHFSSSS